MPFIIEGPDGVGKTTLAHKIVKHCAKLSGEIGQYLWPVYYAHMDKPPKTWNYYQDYILRMQPFAVQDRFHYGGYIYGKCLKLHGCSLTEDMMRLLEARLDLMGSYRLVIVAEELTLKQKLKDNPKAEIFSTDQILQVNRAYSQMINFEDEHGAYNGPAFATRPDLVWAVHRNHEYVDDTTIAKCVQEWFHRLSVVFQLDHKENEWGRR